MSLNPAICAVITIISQPLYSLRGSRLNPAMVNLWGMVLTNPY